MLPPALDSFAAAPVAVTPPPSDYETVMAVLATTHPGAIRLSLDPVLYAMFQRVAKEICVVETGPHNLFQVGGISIVEDSALPEGMVVWHYLRTTW